MDREQLVLVPGSPGLELFCVILFGVGNVALRDKGEPVCVRVRRDLVEGFRAYLTKKAPNVYVVNYREA